jgi:hypothetical protein
MGLAAAAARYQIAPRSTLTRGALTGAYPYGKAPRRTPDLTVEIMHFYWS